MITMLGSEPWEWRPTAILCSVLFAISFVMFNGILLHFQGFGSGAVQHISKDAAHQEAGAGWASFCDGPAVRVERNADRTSVLRIRGEGTYTRRL